VILRIGKKGMNHSEKIRHRQYQLKYSQKYQEKIKEKDLKYYQENKEKIKERDRKNRHRIWTRSTIQSHKRKGYILNVSLDKLNEIAKNTIYCPICERKLNWYNSKLRSNSPTLDRINNEKINNIDSIWIICNQCNTTKGSRTLKEFIEYCKMITNRKLGETNAIV